MTKVSKRSGRLLISLLPGMFILAACNSVAITSTPAVPVEWVTGLGGVAFVSLPISIHHASFQIDYYDERGKRLWETSEEELFPADVFVVYDGDHQTARVFLARSPHMGCLLKWVAETKSFEDPCYGSRFSIDGAYEFGPAPRSLDELPAEVKDHMVWVKNELVYGEEHR